MADKGEYRGIYVALIDSPEFQALSADARSVFWPLKLRLGKAGIDVFYPETLPRYTGLPSERVSEGLRELLEADWVRVEKNVYWIRNGLRFDPSNPLNSPNQRKGIVSHLGTLPKVQLVNDFAEYYELDLPFPDLPRTGNPPERVSEPLRSTEDGRRKTEDGIPPGVAAAREPQDLEVIDAEVILDDEELPRVPADTGRRTAAPPSPDWPELPFRGHEWAGRVSGAVVLQEWIRLQPTAPSRSDRDRFGRACKRLADDHPTWELAYAFVGMNYLWPFGDPKTGQQLEAWTPEDLLRKFAKALPAARHHPEIQQATQHQQFEEALMGGGPL